MELKVCCKDYIKGIQYNIKQDKPYVAAAYADNLAIHIRIEHTNIEKEENL